MDQQHPYDAIGGSPTPPSAPPTRRVPRVAVAVGLTAFLGLAGAGLAFAVGGSGTPGASLSSSATSSTTVAKGAHRFPGPPGRFGPGLGGGNVVHGEYTVRQGTSYKTIIVQVGTVDSVSSSSIVVTSSDGWGQTYVVQSSTVVDSQAGGISAVSAKDTVRLEAVVQGQSQIAVSIVDTTKIGNSRQGFGFGMGRAKGGPGGPPATAGGPGGTTA